MTYAIVARDDAAGEIGAAVQSHFFNVGPIALWPLAGTGVIATMAIAEREYGRAGLELLRGGASAESTLTQLLQGDSMSSVRQVGILGVRGPPAVHTGSSCIPAAGHCLHDNVVALGNLLTRQGTWERMVQTFLQTQGTLAERLFAALEAAERCGGDLRGTQTAALAVVSTRSPAPFGTVASSAATYIDLRVEDSPGPLVELRRLLDLDSFYKDLMRLLQTPGVFAGEYSQAEVVRTAAIERLAAGQQLLGDNHEATFWLAVLLIRGGRTADARRQFLAAVATHAPWAEMAARITRAGMLTSPQHAALTL